MVHALLQPVQRSLALLERWRLERGGGEFQDTVNQSSIELSGTVGDFGVDDLQELAKEGNRAELEIAQGAWSARVRVEPGARFVVDSVAGPIDEAFPDPEVIREIEAARDEERAVDFLRLAADVACVARLSVENRPRESGFHWVRTTSALLDHLERHTWMGLIAALYADESPHRLVLHDAGNGLITGADIVLHGPEVYPPDPPGADSESWREYAESWLHDERSELPPPVAVYPAAADGLLMLFEIFSRIAHVLSWVWLASTTQIDGSTVVIRFEGSPDLDFDLTQLPAAAHAAEAVRLWEWSVATTDPARREALQQAVSLVVREPSELERAPERVLRTAKYLLRLAKQGTVAEALAIRRTARQAAMDAGRTLAEASRVASRSVVDRVIAQLIGAFGVLLANQAELINTTVAGWLLIALLGLTAATAGVAFAFEFTSANAGLTAFERDLDAYSDMLIEEDINHIKTMETIATARRQLARARWISGSLLILAATALTVARLRL